VRVCPSCGTENADDVDFCASCGAYVRWEPTRITTSIKPAAPQPEAQVAAPEAPPAAVGGDGQAAAPVAPAGQQPAAPVAPPPATPPPGAPPPPPEPAAPQVPPDSIVLALHLPGEDSTEGPIVANVEPGGVTWFYALVRNQSGIVDNYDVSIAGLPAEWFTISPSTLYLVPYGASAEGYEQEVELRFNPPRSPVAEARPWPIQIVVSSRAHDGAVVGTADATLVIGPYQEIASEMRPQRKRGITRARFAIAVRNRANAPAQVAVAATDAAGTCQFTFERPTFGMNPGRRQGTIFWVRPQKQIIIGRNVDHPFTLTAQAVGSETAAMPQMGVYVQRPWLPWWLLLLLPFLIGLAVLAFLLWPEKPVTVPSLLGFKRVEVAQVFLEKRGLTLGQKTTKATTLRVPGSIINQHPRPGNKVDKGTPVDVTIAVSPTIKPKVPDVVGKTFLDASAALREVGLQAGGATDDPNAKVVATDPKAGVKVEKGSPVQLFFAKPPTNTGGATSTTGTGGGNGKGKTAGAAAGTAAAVAAAAATAGENDPAQLGIVFDNGKDILEIGSDKGKPLKPLVKSDDIEDEPTVNSDGTQVAFERGPTPDKSQIWLIKPKTDKFPHALTNAGFRDHRPSFSPDGSTIAFVREKPVPGQKTTQGDLCFISARATGDVPNCLIDPSSNVQRPAWNPDGTKIVAMSQPTTPTPGKPARLDLELFTSQRANSPSAGDWNAQGVLTDKIEPAKSRFVLFAAFSQDGKALAFTANYVTGLFHLFVAPVADGVPAIDKAKALVRVAACEVAWRPSGLLAIVQRDAQTCSQQGVIARIDPRKPAQITPLTKIGLGAENPSWTLVAPR
jgi:hypothetical protein